MMPKAAPSFLPAFDLRGREGLAQASAIAGLLVAAIVLGGASAAGITANAVLQVAGVVAIAAVLMRRWPVPMARAERRLLILAVLLALLYLVQLVPLPPALWTALPGRETLVAGFGTLGVPLPWMPLSLAPAQTLHSGVALLAPIAMLLMVARFQRPVGRVAILALLGTMLVSVLLGVAQFSGSGTYFYAISNRGSATGFFPNSNHFATLMCLSMPLAAGLVARWRGGADGQSEGASRAFAVAVLLGIVLVGLLGVAMTQSLAGLLLAAVAIIGSAAIVLTRLDRRLRIGFLAGVVAVIAIGGAVIFTGMAGDFGINTGGGEDLSRPSMWRVTAHAIAAFGAVGSGFGSFQQVFHLFEDPARVSTHYANHAHNDLLEYTLEGGIPGLVLLAAFLVWFVARLLQIWVFDRRRDPLAQGAAIAALIVLLHSLVDYPLRTGAIATVFAFCLGLMARESSGTERQEPAEQQQPGRHLSA